MISLTHFARCPLSAPLPPSRLSRAPSRGPLVRPTATLPAHWLFRVPVK